MTFVTIEGGIEKGRPLHRRAPLTRLLPLSAFRRRRWRRRRRRRNRARLGRQHHRSVRAGLRRRWRWRRRRGFCRGRWRRDRCRLSTEADTSAEHEAPVVLEPGVRGQDDLAFRTVDVRHLLQQLGLRVEKIAALHAEFDIIGQAISDRPVEEAR